MNANRAPVFLSIADLEATPDDGNRYELIDGEIHVSTAPGFYHQSVLMNLGALLWNFLREHSLGTVLPGVGVVFDDHNGVIPDLVYASRNRLREVLVGGRLMGAPEIAIEILSPGAGNEKRDRHIKLNLYSARGVDEYWIVDPENQSVEIYRRSGQRTSGDANLDMRVNLLRGDELTSPVLPGFGIQVSSLFAGN
jgi:Uma2 family endonuclease